MLCSGKTCKLGATPTLFQNRKMISHKIKAQKWGAKELCQTSADLQKELPPGLKGYSPGNLKKIRIFAEAYFPQPEYFIQRPRSKLD